MKYNRIHEIEKYLIEHKFASIRELCRHFNVSINTIRRDISELCNRGIASKVYGGVTINNESHVVPFSARRINNPDEKIIVAELASQYIESGETIYIDSGSTTVNLLRFIPENIKLTIISNSLTVCNEAINYPHLNVISTGGLLNSKTNSFIGMTAVHTINSFQINKAFMAASGVSLSNGATNNSFHEAEIKKVVTNSCQSIILMIDHSKIDHSASISFCPLELLQAFVTDKKPSQEYLDFFSTRKISCLYDHTS